MTYANSAKVRRAWYCCDWANSVFSTSVTAVFLGPYLTDVARAAADPAGFVHPLGVAVRAEAWYPVVTGLAMLLLLGALPAVAVATRRLPRARLLGALSVVGAGSTIGLATVDGSAYLRGGALFVLATVMLGSSVVVINTYLPEIADPDDRGRVSGTASAAGYVSGSLVLAMSVGLIAAGSALGWPESGAVRLCMLLAGLWWLVFGLLPAFVLPNTPTEGGRSSPRATAGALWRTPLLPMFLLGFLLYNSGYQAVNSVSSTFGSEELRIDEVGLIAAVLVANAAGAAGAAVAGRLTRRWGAQRVLVGSLLLLAAAVAIGAGTPAGLLPAFLGLAAAIGAGIGSVYPISRAVFADLAPAGAVGASFAVFEIVNRSLSAVGLLTVGLVLQLGAGYRVAMASLTAFLLVGALALIRVGRTERVSA